MPLLNKAAILDIAEQGFNMTEVAVPEWGKGVSVKARELSASEFQKVNGEMGAREGKAAIEQALDYVYDVAVWCILNEDGSQMFEQGDQKVLRQKARTSTFYQGLVRIMNAVLELSGMITEQGEETEPVP